MTTDQRHGLAIVAGCMLAILAGCYVVANLKSCNELCTLTSRNYVPAHTNHWTTMECVSRDTKTGTCRMSIPVQHSQFVPDRWSLVYSDCNGESHAVATTRDGYDGWKQGTKQRLVLARWKECPCL